MEVEDFSTADLSSGNVSDSSKQPRPAAAAAAPKGLARGFFQKGNAAPPAAEGGAAAPARQPSPQPQRKQPHPEESQSTAAHGLGASSRRGGGAAAPSDSASPASLASAAASSGAAAPAAGNVPASAAGARPVPPAQPPPRAKAPKRSKKALKAEQAAERAAAAVTHLTRRTCTSIVAAEQSGICNTVPCLGCMCPGARIRAVFPVCLARPSLPAASLIWRPAHVRPTPSGRGAPSDELKWRTGGSSGSRGSCSEAGIAHARPRWGVVWQLRGHRGKHGRRGTRAHPAKRPRVRDSADSGGACG